jgi:hypothetical protein
MYINAVDPDFLCTDYYPYMEPWNQVMLQTKFSHTILQFCKLQLAAGPLCIQHPSISYDPTSTLLTFPFYQPSAHFHGVTVTSTLLPQFSFTNHPLILTVRHPLCSRSSLLPTD